MERLSEFWWQVVRFGFRLLYNEMAFTYDTVSWVVSLGAWREWQRTALNHLPHTENNTVLELAFGTGNLHQDLLLDGYRVVGLDLSPHMARITSAKLQREQLPINLLRGRGEALPFANEAVDAVVCTFPTPFIFEQATLENLYRVLKPGGRLVIVLSGMLTGKNPSVAVLEWLYEITGQRGEAATEDVLHAFFAVGFEATAMQESCEGSVALLIVADKPLTSD
ncbi:MAG: class I SAM-dependent methyltransferase [Chloroflexota bacterium]